MEFFTRQGDDGYTGLLGEGRVPKYHPRPDTAGTIDEASAALGCARAISSSGYVNQIVIQVQRDLYLMMAEISSTPENFSQFRAITSEHIVWLESETNRLSEQVEMPKEFILPGDSPGGAYFSLARTIVRRAERLVARLFHDGEINNVEILKYLNRLSSLCFVLELLENQASGMEKPTLAKV